MGTMVADMRLLGMEQVDRERLKMEVNTSASWSAQSLNTLSGPAAFLGFTPRNALLTASVSRENVRASVGESANGVADVNSVLVPFVSKRAKKWLSVEVSLNLPPVGRFCFLDACLQVGSGSAVYFHVPRPEDFITVFQQQLDRPVHPWFVVLIAFDPSLNSDIVNAGLNVVQNSARVALKTLL